MMKQCGTCKRFLEATTENFCNKNGKLNSKCKKCANEYAKRYREANKEKIKEDMKKYHKKNSEKLKEKRKLRYEEKKDEILKFNKEYYYKNRERIRKQQKIYRENHLEEEKERNKRYKELHIQEKREYYAMWAKENPEKVRIKSQKRRTKKSKLPNDLTCEQWEKIKKYFNYKCAYCGEELKLEQDHFIPLSKGGEYTKNNIIPACRICNGSKLDRDFFEWYPKFKNYSKTRENNILKFLNYKDDKHQQLTLIV